MTTTLGIDSGPGMSVDTGPGPGPGMDSGAGGGEDATRPAANCNPECGPTEFCNRATMTCVIRSGEPLCNNDCRFAGDGDCDDGGPMCRFSLCDFGSDCMDCGPRQEAQRPPAGASVDCPCGVDCGDGMFCNDTTMVCEACNCAGRVCGIPPGADSACNCGSCADGMFCNEAGQCGACDCGGRQCGSNPTNPSCPSCGTCAEGSFCMRDSGMCMAEAGTPLCNNMCNTAGDGECDDGGPMCQFSICEFGSDCADCGMRQEAQRPPAGSTPDCSGPAGP